MLLCKTSNGDDDDDEDDVDDNDDVLIEDEYIFGMRMNNDHWS